MCSGRQVAALRLGEFVVADDAEHVVQPGDSALDVDQRLFGEDLASYLAHRRNRRPQRVIRPNDDRDPRLAKEYDGRRVVLGRDDEQRREPLPFGGEIEDLVGNGQAGVDEDAVGAGLDVSRRPVERLGATPPGDERLGAGDDAEVWVGLDVLARPDLAAELLDVGQRLIAVEERVGLRKDLVLDAHGGDVALAQLGHQSAKVVEVAVPGVAVDENRNAGAVRHEFQRFQQLRPGRFVAVAQPEGRGDGEPGRPDQRKPRFFDDFRRQAVVCLHGERQLPSEQELGEAPGFFRHPVLPRVLPQREC